MRRVFAMHLLPARSCSVHAAVSMADPHATACMQQVQDLQQCVALVNASPLLGIPEAAELIMEHLKVDLVA